MKGYKLTFKGKSITRPFLPDLFWLIYKTHIEKGDTFQIEILEITMEDLNEIERVNVFGKSMDDLEEIVDFVQPVNDNYAE